MTDFKEKNIQFAAFHYIKLWIVSHFKYCTWGCDLSYKGDYVVNNKIHQYQETCETCEQ